LWWYFCAFLCDYSKQSQMKRSLQPQILSGLWSQGYTLCYSFSKKFLISSWSIHHIHWSCR
jgi:hypothetical protein